MSPPTSRFCTSRVAVIQACVREDGGQIDVNGRRAPKVSASTVFPASGHTIACPLTYLQEHASLRNRWIRAEDGRQIPLDGIGELNAFTVTILDCAGERECVLPSQLQGRLLRFFMADVAQNKDQYVNFDCYAFVSFLIDTAFQPESPPFSFEERTSRPGEIVVLADGPNLPNSIKHWALDVGEGLLLSKFGQTGKGAQALIELTGVETLRFLYECDRTLVATRRFDAPEWDQTRWEL